MNSLSEPDDLARSFREIEQRRLRALMEATLFACPEPVTVRELARALVLSKDVAKRSVAA